MANDADKSSDLPEYVNRLRDIAGTYEKRTGATIVVDDRRYHADEIDHLLTIVDQCSDEPTVASVIEQLECLKFRRR